MALRDIVYFPDPFLRQPTHKVETVDDSILTLVEDMIETMYKKDGVGLAAIQIGSSAKIFVIESSVAGLPATEPPVVFINPVIEWLSSQKESEEEGCLSFPGIFVNVSRPARARVRATNLLGEEFTMEGEGLFARAIQHEQDHLENKLLIDHAGPMKRQLIRKKMDRFQEENNAHRLKIL